MNKYNRLPRREVPTYPIEPENKVSVIESEEHNTCPYGWLFGVGACVTSLCTLIVLVIFFIWMATKGVSLN